jgi:hypothetical protein
MITRLVASPNPATVGQEVIISIEGKGACQEVFLQLGEGSGLRVLTRVDFEKGRNVSAPAQVFTVAKNYPLKAIAGRGCVGAAALYLAVLPQGPPKKPAPKPTR